MAESGGSRNIVANFKVYFFKAGQAPKNQTTHLSATVHEWYKCVPRVWESADRQKKLEPRNCIAFMKLFLEQGFALDPSTDDNKDQILVAGTRTEETILVFLKAQGNNAKKVSGASYARCANCTSQAISTITSQYNQGKRVIISSLKCPAPPGMIPPTFQYEAGIVESIEVKVTKGQLVHRNDSIADATIPGFDTRKLQTQGSCTNRFIKRRNFSSLFHDSLIRTTGGITGGRPLERSPRLQCRLFPETPEIISLDNDGNDGEMSACFGEEFNFAPSTVVCKTHSPYFVVDKPSTRLVVKDIDIKTIRDNKWLNDVVITYYIRTQLAPMGEPMQWMQTSLGTSTTSSN